MRKVTEIVAGATEPSPQPPLNHILLLLDASSSMTSVSRDVPMVVQRFLNSIRQASYDTKQETRVSLAIFNSVDPFRVLFSDQHPEAATFGYFSPQGMTPLNQAVNQGIDHLTSQSQGRPNESFLLIVVTDGGENASAYGTRSPRIGILERQAAGNWTFVFSVPPGAAEYTSQMTGVPSGNIQVWEGTSEGFKEQARRTDLGTQSYFAGRAQGLLQTSAFYTDLSKVTSKDLVKLEDVTRAFRRLRVGQEDEIAPFVRDAGYDYQPGRAFYELTKPEKVQSHKNIVLAKKGSTKLWGGPEAKKLVGIPEGQGVTVKVTPGNHANYRIFVQSTSMNRKLVRGTDLLYQVR